ncbi:e3 ubiquitin-protein ligase listerin [Caerostris extrusa]|uniref:E3 ubiquitin-protein ligase listerin n=1 Tax=Caerostris extrusa TaxID=172846 RepID=A0AAV4XBZ4_CAEEX|nr:e3 ubiquitin-protein ligase listerin [Caerostris extrusa]
MLKDLMQDLMKMEDPTDKNLTGRMGELCCYLLDKDNILSVANLEDFLKGLFNTIINYDFRNGSNADLKYTYHLQMLHILSCGMEYELCLVDPKIWNFLVNLLCIKVEECMFKTFDSPTNLMCLYQAVIIFSSLCELQAQLLDTESDWKPKPISDHIYEDVVHLFIYTANALNDSGPLPEMCEIVMSEYLEAVTYIPGKNLISMMQCENPEVKLNNEFSVFKELIMLLTSRVRQIQFASHTLLLKIMPIIPSTLTEKSQCSSEDEFEEDALKIPDMLSPLVEQLKTLSEIAQNMLLDLKIGDLCTVVPYTDSYTFSMGYLLAWIELMEFISASPSQIRLGYAIYLKEMELLTPLFSNVFHFMPENPVTCLKKGLKLETPSKEDLKLLFIKPPKLNSVSPSSEEIQSIACYVFSSVLRTVPASIRQWWANLDKRSADVVNCFTSKYVSGLLCATEIQAVHENEKQFENLMVQARPGSREVIATYTIDDCAIELYVQLPVNHPLGPIKAERRGKVVIGQMEWRHWLMQLTTVLTYQNGSILDGLSIWKRNLDKKFEGVEECMICYYILHNSTLKLPKLSCHVCRKKFHSACLYKWFRTSNNFTCPLCRNEFTM